MSDFPLYKTPAEVADEVFRGKVSEYYVATHAKDWPHIRIGRSVLFTSEHVAEIAAMNEHRPAPAPVADSHGQRTRGPRAAS
jgi:hypothetical protein